jgi:hypothetical protein
MEDKEVIFEMEKGLKQTLASWREVRGMHDSRGCHNRIAADG